jgi:hypothetical protein
MNLKTKTMIQSSELRMSNYVYSSDFVIKSYSPQGLFNLMKNIDDGYNNIKPIPLTEQWLIDFGFEKIDDHRFKIKPTEMDFYYTYSIHDYAFRIYVQGSIICANCLHYVHQLQNLYFALTNKELNYESKS